MGKKTSHVPSGFTSLRNSNHHDKVFAGLRNSLLYNEIEQSRTGLLFWLVNNQNIFKECNIHLNDGRSTRL